MASILLIDAEEAARAQHSSLLAECGHSVKTAGSAAAARVLLRRERFDIVVTDLMLPDGDGMDIVQLAKQRDASTEVVVMTSVAHVAPAVRAIRGGAADYLVKPVPLEVFEHVVARAVAMRELVDDNELLRQYVALVEAARRVATAPSQRHVIEGAYASFAQITGAAASLFYLRGETDIFSLQPGHTLTRDMEYALAKHFADALAAAGAKESVLPAPAGFTHVLTLPICDDQKHWASCVLLFDRAPSETLTAAAVYLARNVAIGLANSANISVARDLAYRDELTGLFNLRYLNAAIEEIMRAAELTKTSMSVLFMDLDHFKQINDTYGHTVGSSVLIELGRLLRGCVRDHDAIVRYGGDEFVLLLPKADPQGAALVASRICKRVSEHRFLAREGRDLLMTASIGAASYPQNAKSKQLLLEAADAAMYVSKVKRNCFTLA